MSVIKDTFFGGAAKKAGKAEQEAARAGARLTREQFEDIRGLSMPFIDPAAGALGQQAALSGAAGPEAQRMAFEQFQEDPGTQFLREQGLRLIGSGAAATGQLGGGERLRELTKFSQGLALQDLGSRFNQLGAVTGTGLSALGALGGVSRAAAAGQSQALQAAGAAKAGGIIGRAEGIKSGLQSLGGLMMSDIRLKTNIEQIGNLPSGLPWYKWEWTEDGKRLAGDQVSIGVMAQEAQQMFPDAVVEIDGCLRVDYSRLN